MLSTGRTPAEQEVERLALTLVYVLRSRGAHPPGRNLR